MWICSKLLKPAARLKIQFMLPEKEGYVLVDDPESGQLYYITKAEDERRRKSMYRFLSLIKNPPIKGTILILSTPSDLNSSDDFKKLWEDNHNEQ